MQTSKFLDTRARAAGLAAIVAFACNAHDSEIGQRKETPAPIEPDAGNEKTVASPSISMHPRLQRYIVDVLTGFETIPPDRKQQLERLALFVQTKRSAGETAKLTYICTHNSRRSHMSQLWAATAAAYYGIDAVATYSGGTEISAFNPRAVAALERAGFEIDTADPDASNPRYTVTYAPEGPRLEAFSKRYADDPNPGEDFAAVMTCSQADRNCPLVGGASLRVALPYEDPKAADGTPHEAKVYDERARQIATEMFYLFSRVPA